MAQLTKLDVSALTTYIEQQTAQMNTIRNNMRVDQAYLDHLIVLLEQAKNADPFDAQAVADAQAAVDKKQAVVDAQLAKLKAKNAYRNQLKAQLDLLKQSGSKGGTSGLPTTQKPPAPVVPMIYNVPAAKDTYFHTSMFPHNSPTYKIADARELWASVAGSKGMLQTWIPPTALSSLVTANQFSGSMVSQKNPLQKYGFQFMYNPTSVQLSYQAKDLGIDIGYEISGQDKSSPMQGTAALSFELRLNRIIDVALLNADGSIKPTAVPAQVDTTSAAGIAAASALPSTPTGSITAQDLYGISSIPTADLSKIAAKGTVYDLEALFYTLLGWDIKTQLRGTTPDFGIILNRRVEVHLGDPIRYVGYVSDLQIDHQIFNEKMVPTYTIVNMTVNIIPDPDGAWATFNGGAGTTGGTTTTGSTGATGNSTQSNGFVPSNYGAGAGSYKYGGNSQTGRR